jgi:hypothetical protein
MLVVSDPLAVPQRMARIASLRIERVRPRAPAGSAEALGAALKRHAVGVPHLAPPSRVSRGC